MKLCNPYRVVIVAAIIVVPTAGAALGDLCKLIYDFTCTTFSEWLN